MNILKTKIKKINLDKQFLNINKKKYFNKSDFLFKINNFNLMDSLKKDNYFYPQNKRILLQNKSYLNDQLFTHKISKKIFFIKLLKILFYLKKNKNPLIRCRVIHYKHFKTFVNIQGYVFSLPQKDFLLKKITSYRKWKRAQVRFMMTEVFLFYRLTNKLQIKFSRKPILKLF